MLVLFLAGERVGGDPDKSKASAGAVWSPYAVGSAEGEAGAEDLLDSALEGLGHRLLLNDLGDLLDLLEGQVALVGHVLDLLSISLVASELLDEEGGGAGVDGDFGSPVLALQLDHDSNSLPFSSFLDDVLTDLFGVLHKGGVTRPRGPSLGASVAAGPGSPPNTLMLTG